MAANRLRELVALAHETSSERRRDLLRSLTNMFFAEDAHATAEMELFDDVLTHLADEMEEAVRLELSERMAASPAPPQRLARQLAFDSAEVAAPMLERSTALSEDDLLQVARTQGQEHLRALSRRDGVTIALSDAIVGRGDDRTLGVLMRNQSAQLSRAAQEAVVERAQSNPELHEAVVLRKSLPVDLLNEMYFVVEGRLRDRILQRNAELDPAALEAALESSRKRIAARDGALPEDFAEAERHVRGLLAKGPIEPGVLAAMLRGRQMTPFLIALAEASGIDFHTARRIVERRELDALSIVCKAADFDRPLFLTFALLILGPEADAMGRAREYGDLYSNLPREAAQRTMRFWRVRRQTGDIAA
jgi:uncharacterized protein (DUF2336 family)